ncbi:T-complex protein 1 subunit alpha-like [Hordeum vulgare]|nr:T-complex protein 1 subunit alpha-like [Hordeum vulgare]
MLVDDIGDVTITNDGATILRMLEVEHPAAKILVELAELQYREVGDGTTSVIIIAVELLKSANELVRNKIHPTSIISGYRVNPLAMREACKYVEEKLSVKVDKLGKYSLVNFAKTSMSSKLIHNDKDFFANLSCVLLCSLFEDDTNTEDGLTDVLLLWIGKNTLTLSQVVQF